MRSLVCLLILLLIGALPAYGQAQFSGISGDLSAEAAFSNLGGGTLRVRVTNTSPFDVQAPEDVLTAVFFNVEGDPGLTEQSAILSPGSSVIHGGSDPGGVVGGEWGFAQDPLGLATFNGLARNYGISSSGFSIFGSATFPGSNLDDPEALNGLNYGIVSIGDDPLTGNAKVTGGEPLIQYGVDFTFTGLQADLDLSKVSDVWFQYGTDLNEPGYPGTPSTVPEPGTLGLLCCGVAPIARRLYRKKG